MRVNPDRLGERELNLLLASHDHAPWVRLWQREGDARWFCMSPVPRKGVYEEGWTYTISYAATKGMAILKAQAKALRNLPGRLKGS